MLLIVLFAQKYNAIHNMAFAELHFREGCNAKAFFKCAPEWIRRKGNIIMGTANQIEQELMSYMSDHKIRNMHSHHLPDNLQDYVEWVRKINV